MIIAILGVVNTLALSVIERTREVGLLRAIGVSRRQLRTMIRLEAIVDRGVRRAAGARHGARLRVGAHVRRSRTRGSARSSSRGGRSSLFVVAAAVVGVLAAVVPARRAARLDVLQGDHHGVGGPFRPCPPGRSPGLGWPTTGRGRRKGDMGEAAVTPGTRSTVRAQARAGSGVRPLLGRRRTGHACALRA